VQSVSRIHSTDLLLFLRFLVRLIFGNSRTLFEHYCGTQENTDKTESGKGNEGNHQDGHKCLLRPFCVSCDRGAVMAVTGFCEVAIPIPVRHFACTQGIIVRTALDAARVSAKHADEPDVPQQH